MTAENFVSTVRINQSVIWFLFDMFAQKKKPAKDEPKEDEPQPTEDDDTIDLDDDSDEVSSPLADEEDEEPQKPEESETEEPESSDLSDDDFLLDEKPQKKKNKPFHHTRRDKALFISVIILLGIFGALVALAYVKPLHSTQLASLATNDTASLKSKLEGANETYRLSIESPDGSSVSLPLTTLGIDVDVDASIAAAQAAQKPHNLLNRLRWWHTENVPLVLHVDDAKLTKAINKYATKASKPAKNASLSIKKGVVKVIPEKPGYAITVSDASETFKNQVKFLKDQPITLSKQATEPAITSQNISDSQQKIEDILNTKVTFNIEGKAYKPNKESIGAWIELSPKEEFHTIDIDVNSGRVLKYIDKIAKPHVQPPRSQVVLRQADGTNKVLIAGKNGTDVTQKNNLAAQVATSVLDGKDISVKATVKYAEYKSVSAKAYPKFFVVDITNKRMYAYAKNQLLKTFLVSAGAPGTPTPTGTFKIMSKVRMEDMEGANADGSRYFQADVQWVNYFAPGGYAIHGNHWRPLSYFGNVNSSHGCVGIVNSDAEWIYNWAPIGTPVIIHS